VAARPINFRRERSEGMGEEGWRRASRRVAEAFRKVG
jgi:hypothetical protein